MVRKINAGSYQDGGPGGEMKTKAKQHFFLDYSCAHHHDSGSHCTKNKVVSIRQNCDAGKVMDKTKQTRNQPPPQRQGDHLYTQKRITCTQGSLVHIEPHLYTYRNKNLRSLVHTQNHNHHTSTTHTNV